MSLTRLKKFAVASARAGAGLVLVSVTLAAAPSFARAEGAAPSVGSLAAADNAVPKQVPLDQAVIDRLVAAQPEIAKLQAEAQAGDPARSDPQMQPKLERAARKHGFADFAAYEAAAEAVGGVLSGIDPETKTYVGPAALIRKQMDQVRADKSLPTKEKTETLEQMGEALANVGAEKPSAENIALVVKNYDRLSDGFQTGGE